jgi:flagellar motor switch protein FliN/FliY
VNHPIDNVEVRSFATAFAGALSASVAAVTGSPWPLELTDDREPPQGDTQPLQFRVKVEGRLCGDCFVEFYEPQVSQLITALNAGGSCGAPSDRAEPLFAVLSATVELLKSSLAEQFGSLNFKTDSISGLACGGMFVVPLRVPTGRLLTPSVFLYLDGGLLESLSSAFASRNAAGSSKKQAQPNNLRLVMDVELNVSLRFGQRQLPLREVLELNSGSVVELDRMVDDPVEMLLDGKVIARGEAVIVDGNYGLRVTEIPQALEKHLLG